MDFELLLLLVLRRLIPALEQIRNDLEKYSGLVSGSGENSAKDIGDRG